MMKRKEANEVREGSIQVFKPVNGMCVYDWWIEG